MLDLKKRMMRDESESTISAMAKKRSSKAPNPSKKSTPISIYLKSVLRHSVTEQLSDVAPSFSPLLDMATHSSNNGLMIRCDPFPVVGTIVHGIIS